MARCLHIFDSGFQCVDETLDPTDFCEAHQKIIPFERLEGVENPWRKFVIRLVAFVLLMSLLIPLFYSLRSSLRSLYRGTPAKAQEVW
jgi:hypothetical protein